MTPGKALQQWRLRRGLTQEQLAPLVGKTVSAVSQWEAGRIQPRLATVQQLEQVLDAGGELLAAFGYDSVTPFEDLQAQLDGLTRDVAKLQQQVAWLVERQAER